MKANQEKFKDSIIRNKIIGYLVLEIKFIYTLYDKVELFRIYLSKPKHRI